MHTDGKKDKNGWHFNQPDIIDTQFLSALISLCLHPFNQRQKGFTGDCLI